MLFRQYELGCLSLFSYLVGDETTGRAVVVDPQRDVSQYLEDARRHHLFIERVIETHFHADFLSGHLELAEATGAAICYGAGARAEFPLCELHDGERIELGEVLIEVRATPGHTPESISLVVYERAGDSRPYGVLTGDTLFVGDVGRPDLLAAGGYSAEELASELYRSLWGQLLTLPEETLVYPAHGAGSSCGKSLSAATCSSIGQEKRTNAALWYKDEPSFVAALTAGQPVAPRYFPYAAESNRRRRRLLEEDASPPPLDLDRLLALQQEGAVLLDTRPPEAFAAGHLAGALNVGLEGRFAEYVGDVVEPGDPVLLVTEEGKEQEARVRLGRIGFDTVVGHLPGIERLLAERPALAQVARRIDAARLAAELAAGPQLVDVRNPGEIESSGLIETALSLPLPSLLDRRGELEQGRPTIVYCASGFRSSVAASLLRRAGFAEVSDLLGGFGAWVAAGLPVTTPVR